VHELLEPTSNMLAELSDNGKHRRQRNLLLPPTLKRRFAPTKQINWHSQPNNN
jgi:hypothetical protein